MVRKTVKQNVKKSKASRKITKTIKTKILGGAVKQNIINEFDPNKKTFFGKTNFQVFLKSENLHQIYPRRDFNLSSIDIDDEDKVIRDSINRFDKYFGLNILAIMDNNRATGKSDYNGLTDFHKNILKLLVKCVILHLIILKCDEKIDELKKYSRMRGRFKSNTAMPLVNIPINSEFTGNTTSLLEEEKTIEEPSTTGDINPYYLGPKKYAEFNIFRTKKRSDIEKEKVKTISSELSRLEQQFENNLLALLQQQYAGQNIIFDANKVNELLFSTMLTTDITTTLLTDELIDNSKINTDNKKNSSDLPTAYIPPIILPSVVNPHITTQTIQLAEPEKVLIVGERLGVKTLQGGKKQRYSSKHHQK